MISPIRLLPVNVTQVIKNAVLETLMDNLSSVTQWQKSQI